MAAALDNANPTVLSASQLPTRQNKKATRRLGPDAVYGLPFLDKLALQPRWSWEEHDDEALSSSASASSDDDDEDVVVGELGPDAIDEQEIYGMSWNCLLFL